MIIQEIMERWKWVCRHHEEAASTRQNAFDLEILYTVVKEFCEIGRAKDGLVSKESSRQEEWNRKGVALDSGATRNSEVTTTGIDRGVCKGFTTTSCELTKARGNRLPRILCLYRQIDHRGSQGSWWPRSICLGQHHHHWSIHRQWRQAISLESLGPMERERNHRSIPIGKIMEDMYIQDDAKSRKTYAGGLGLLFWGNCWNTSLSIRRYPYGFFSSSCHIRFNTSNRCKFWNQEPLANYSPRWQRQNSRNF